jgi:chaperonin GroES
MTEVLEPLADRVIIEPVERKKVTKGGVFLPEAAQEKQSQGVIVSAGDGRIDNNGKRIPPSVTKGDKVLFAKYAGVEITLDEKQLIILKESDVLAIVRQVNGSVAG